MRQASRALLESQATPTLIAGRYQIEAALGRGGAAQVLRVSDVSRSATLALKRLSWNAKPRLAAQFELEYQTLASLRHPRIVEVFEYGRDGEGAFYTMELLQGEDLRDHAPVDWRETCGYLRDAAEALGLLHARRLVHRDISPRNLWRCPDGRVKLIDFGALSPFGPVDHLMGTAPFIPPEAFYGQELDQRADLYGLGALAYYLLTGLHAFPAHDPRELPELWRQLPVPPSLAVSELGREDLAQVPAELDALIFALLSQNVLARPASAAELVDRLDALLGVAASTQSDLAEIHLSNAGFIGRTRELRSLRRQLALAARGRGQSCVIQAEAGNGRSRLLRELELAARVMEVSVLHVDANSCPGAYGVASALGLKLLEVLPELARAAAVPHAPLLAHATPQLRERLAAVPVRVRAADVELSVRIQAALRDWFLAVAQQRPLVLLIDGLELLDAGSVAFLLALGLELKQKSILLVATSLLSPARTSTVAERELTRVSHRLSLPALDDGQVRELLDSVFGRVEHVERLAKHLQRTVHGNPGHLIDLCGQLVHRNVIGFVAGTWVLPLELPEAYISGSRAEALLQRLNLLSEGARELARVLSVHADLIPLDLCRALAASVSDDAFVRLGELLELEVLRQGLDGVRFAHVELRRALCSELSAEQIQRTRRVLGTQLLAREAGTTLDRLRAGVHLLVGGDARGADVVAEASIRITMSEGGKIGLAAPYLEEALALFQAHGRPQEEQLCLLVPLSLAGFQTDRRYAQRYGELTVAALEEVVGLSTAKKLRDRLGKRLSLLAGLAYAGAKAHARRKNRRVLRFKQALPLLFNCVATLAASSSACLDAAGARRYAEVLEPFTAFGTKHIAAFMYEFCLAIAGSSSDRPGKTYQRWQRILAQLESEERIRGVSKKLRSRYHDAALVMSGAVEAQSDAVRALKTAELLDESRFSLNRLSAEQLRGLYYAHQGNVKMFERHRQRAEHHAIQQGTTWQVETWATGAGTAMYMRMHDAMGMKQAFEQLQRLAQDIPALELHARRARGSYLMMRGRYAEALPWLEECLHEEPRAVAGWARAQGSLARARNRLGDYGIARDLCLSALRLLDPEDLDYAPFNLLLETELLIAEAGLGDAAAARRGLSELLARHEPQQGPLTLGELHEAGVEVALLLNDDEGAKRHFSAMERWYLATAAPSLAQRCETLAKRVSAPEWSLERERGGETSAAPRTHGTSLTRRMHTVDRMLAGGSMSLAERAHKALQIIADKGECKLGALYLFVGSADLVQFSSLAGESFEPAVEHWLRERMADEGGEDVTQLIEDDPEDAQRDLFQHAGRFYRLLVLTAARTEVLQVVGAVLLASDADYPKDCPSEIVRSVGHHMRRALQQDESTSLH